MWILGSARRELSSFYGLALAIIFSFYWWKDRPIQTFIALFVIVAIDASHVYATLWRSFFNNTEIKRSLNLHLGIIGASFIVVFFWSYLGIPFLWSAIVYLTVFHHIRQIYGIHRWSVAINPNSELNANKELYALAVIPFIGYHFRSDIDYQGVFLVDDLWLMPNSNLLYICYGLLIITVLSLISKCYQKRHNLKLSVLSTIIFPSAINIFCFLIASNFYLSFLPVLAFHGLSYYHLTTLAKIRLSSKPKHYLITFIIIVFIAVVFGLAETLFTESQIEIISSELYQWNWLMSLGVALIITPSIYHYIIDGYLWRKKNPDFKTIVYSNSK